MKFFGKTNNVEPNEDNLKLSLEDNTIVFAVDKNNELTIKLSIQNLDNENARKLAEVLCFMGRDVYKKQLIQMLHNIASDDPTRREFIADLLLYWSTYIDMMEETDYNKDGPVISPLKFSQIVMGSESKV